MAKMKDQILALRGKGYSYKQIVDELGCSKGTVAYHCGDGQKKKTRDRNNKSRVERPVIRKIEYYKNRVCGNGRPVVVEYLKSPSSMLKDKLRGFASRGKSSSSDDNCDFSYSDFMEKYGDIKQCYLTGRPIDYSDTNSFSFDHIIPVSKGGDNTLDNLGVACKEANYAKADLELEEFIKLCYDVLIHWEIIKEIDDPV